MADNFADHASGFIQLICQAMLQSVAHGLGGGSASAEVTDFEGLPATWAAMIPQQNNGITVQQTGQSITITSPAGEWSVTISVTANS